MAGASLTVICHQAVHSETGEEPIARWARATPAERAVPDPGGLREAFLWPERRRATKTALVSLHGNSYQVGAWLAGRYVELVFDPFDLDRIEVRLAEYCSEGGSGRAQSFSPSEVNRELAMLGRAKE